MGVTVTKWEVISRRQWLQTNVLTAVCTPDQHISPLRVLLL